MKKCSRLFDASHAAREIRGADSLLCHVSEDGKAVYLSSGYWVLVTTPEDYLADGWDKLTGRAPGNWGRRGKNAAITEQDTEFVERITTDYAKKASKPLTIAPIMIPRGKGYMQGAYCAASGVISAYNADFLAMAPGPALLWTTDGTDKGAALAASDSSQTSIVAMILPIKLDGGADDTFARAVRAYTHAPDTTEAGKKEKALAAQVEDLQAQLVAARAYVQQLVEDFEVEHAERLSVVREALAQRTEERDEARQQLQEQKHAAAADLEAARLSADLLKHDLTEARAAAQAARDELESLQAKLAAAQTATETVEQEQARAQTQEQEPPAATEPVQQEQARQQERPEMVTDATPAAIAAQWEALGLTVTIKGARTASPVVWVSGDTRCHAAALKAAGARWSFKRSAWYFKPATA